MDYEEMIDKLLMPPPPKRLKDLNVFITSTTTKSHSTSENIAVKDISSNSSNINDGFSSTLSNNNSTPSCSKNHFDSSSTMIEHHQINNDRTAAAIIMDSNNINKKELNSLAVAAQQISKHKIQIQEQQQQCCQQKNNNSEIDDHTTEESTSSDDSCISSKRRGHHRHNSLDNNNEQQQHHRSNNNSEGLNHRSNSRTKMVNTRFSDIIGHGHAKLRLDEALLPLALPQQLADSILTGVRAAPASILLHGPPGCGKTQLARAVAGEAQAAFISVGPSDVLSKFVGESEAAIRALFREARMRAEQIESRCSVLFFDEIDALGQSRGGGDGSGGMGNASSNGEDNGSRRILAELLIQMTKMSSSNNNSDDGNSSESEEEDEDDSGNNDDVTDQQYESNNVVVSPSSDDSSPSCSKEANRTAQQQQRSPKPRIIVIAATNRPEDCDPALLRRFSVRVLVDTPSRRDRKRIIGRLLSNIDHSLSSRHMNEIAVATDGWSGSDLESLTREAAMTPIRECIRAAAVLKAKVRKMQQQQKNSNNLAAESSSSSLNVTQDKDDMLPDEDEARESLLNNFLNLRPVSIDDFESAVAFWTGVDQQYQRTNQQKGRFGFHCPTPQQVHYDSSSDSDDDAVMSYK